MTKKAINQIIHKAKGLCWHESAHNGTYPEEEKCKHCGRFMRHVQLENLDYTSRKKFLDLWDWALGQSWWTGFLREWASGDFDLDTYPQEHVENVISFGFILVAQPFFAERIAEWLKKSE